MMAAQLCDYTKIQWINCMAYKSYLKKAVKINNKETKYYHIKKQQPCHKLEITECWSTSRIQILIF